jgi:hypothetical protein
VPIRHPPVRVEATVVGPWGRAAPLQVVGELHLGGPGLARDWAGGRYRTGHLARELPGGDIELLGLADSYLDFRGFRFQPGRLEAALADCPGVGELAVVVRDDDPAEPRLVAYVVSACERPPTLSELRRVLWDRLPGSLWPAQCVVVAALPRRPDGGVEEALLPPPPPLGTDDATSAAPTPQERLVASLWAEAQGGEEVAVTDDYRESFAFIEAMSLAHEDGAGITAQHVMRNRTVETLAAALAMSETSSEASDAHRP